MSVASEIAKQAIQLLPELIKVLSNALKHDNPKAALKRAAAAIAARKGTTATLNAALRRRNAKPVRRR